MTLGIQSDGISSLILLGVLTIAVIVDLKSHRIPNMLTASALCLGTGLQVYFGGLAGLLTAVLGAVIGLLVFIPFYAKKAMGAGDLKLMAAVGSFLGAPQVFYAIAATLICGGVFGMLVFALHGGSGNLLSRYFGMARTLAVTGQLVYLPPPADSAAHHKFPYATAIFAGTLYVLIITDQFALDLTQLH
jgi:prepilin peptidase CpaA